MIQTFLGFITALGVVSWGVRWYLSQQERAVRVPAARATEPVKTEQESPPLVSHETAEQLMQPKPVEVEVSPKPGATTDDETSEPVAPSPASLSDADVVEGQLVNQEAIDDLESSLASEAVDNVASGSETDTEESQTTVAAPESEQKPAASNEPVQELATTSGEPEQEPEETFPEDAIVGYCARCRQKRVVSDATRTETKKGKPAIRGRCAVCDAGMFVFTSRKK